MLFWLRPWDKLLSRFFSSIWRDTQIGLLEPFFCSNSGNPKLRIFNLLLLWNQKFSEVNSIFMHFVTFFFFSFSPEKSLFWIYSLLLFGLYFFSIFWVKTNLECMSHNLFPTALLYELLFIQSMNHFSKTSSCLFFDKDGFRVRKAIFSITEVDFSLVCLVGFFKGDDGWSSSNFLHTTKKPHENGLKIK